MRSQPPIYYKYQYRLLVVQSKVKDIPTIADGSNIFFKIFLKDVDTIWLVNKKSRVGIAHPVNYLANISADSFLKTKRSSSTSTNIVSFG